MVKESRNICVNLWDESEARIENNPDVYIIFAEFVGQNDHVITEVVNVATNIINEWEATRHIGHLTMDDLKKRLEKSLSSYLEGIISIMVKPF